VAWQEVARRVAHEIKNPLTPIQISIDRMHRSLGPYFGDDHPKQGLFKECVEQVRKQVLVIRNLVKEFSDFARLPEPRLVELDLPSYLKTLLHDYRFMHPHCNFEFINSIQ